MSTRTGKPEHRAPHTRNIRNYVPGTAPAPRHSTATHVHHFEVVAVFEGRRESIAQCSCQETKVVFRTEADA